MEHQERMKLVACIEEDLARMIGRSGESLGVALHDLGRGRPGRRRLLEGYFELRREVTVELLIRSCEHASEEEIQLLADACFILRDGARCGPTCAPRR